jgi:hypothetical protein
MGRRIFALLPRLAPQAAGVAPGPGSGPFPYRHWLPGFGPVIVRPQLARHGGGGAGGGHGGGGHGGGSHQAVFGSGRPGYPHPAGSGGGTDWKTILFSVGGIAGYLGFLVLGLEREVMAVVVIAAVVFGVPLLAILVLLLLAWLAPHLPGGNRPRA